uniref:Uncharacterized protein n=1 Tax=Junco hyemalis TaxID=40217 RepID=A0A8C5JIM4_JUNHY
MAPSKPENGQRWPDVCPCVPAEGRVAEEAEEVFRSYAFYRYQQERQECGAELPAWPDSPCPPSTGSQVGQRLAIIGDDIYRRYDAEFRTMLESLQPTPPGVGWGLPLQEKGRGGQVWSVLLVKPTLCLSFTLQPSSFPGLFLCFLPVCTAPIIVPSQAQWGSSGQGLLLPAPLSHPKADFCRAGSSGWAFPVLPKLQMKDPSLFSLCRLSRTSLDF